MRLYIALALAFTVLSSLGLTDTARDAETSIRDNYNARLVALAQAGQ
jgi:hypothetical protein